MLAATQRLIDDRFVVIVGSSGLAACMYERGTTAHYQFNIPINNPLGEDIMRNRLFREVEFWQRVSLIIWDELPMVHKETLEHVDALLRQLRRNSECFGGIPFVGCGDFKQVGPVMPGEAMWGVVNASVKASQLWLRMNTYRLQVSVRQADDPEFEQFIDGVGLGINQYEDLSMLGSVYTDVECFQFLYPQAEYRDAAHCCKRAYLAVLNSTVDRFNNFVLDQLPGEARNYYSSNVIREQHDFNARNIPYDNFLSDIEQSGLPLHILKLKQGALCCLMRNISTKDGLAKNAKVVVLSVHRRHVMIQTLPDNGEPGIIFPLTKRTFESRENRYAGYTVLRQQIPLRVAYAMTYNGCQAATLDKVALDVRVPSFTHGQLYTALSRVRNRHSIVTRREFGDPPDGPVRNIVYQDLI